MHAWLFFSILVMVAWGVTGIFQKLSTNYISAGSTLILLVIGSFLIQPWVMPEVPLSSYSLRAVIYGLLSGLMNALGAWGLFEAMKLGGTASVVTVFTALYPLPVVLLSPLLFHEKVTALQGAGIVCAFIAVVLLSWEPPPEPFPISRYPLRGEASADKMDS